MTDLTSGVEFRLAHVDELHEDPSNARGHSDRNKAAVRSSLKEFGQVEALVVQRGTGRVIGGNCRLAELRALGQEQVWIAEVDADSMQAARLGITLNRTAELADWQHDVLQGLLAEMPDPSGLGWDDEELALILEGAGAVGDDEWSNALDDLPSGERETLHTMTFTLTSDQRDSVVAALEQAKAMGDFGETGNDNKNGNALARVADLFRDVAQ